MPIHSPLTIQPLSDSAFDTIDHVVMAACYAAQNTLGRLCDERVYQNDVAARIVAAGVSGVHTEVPVTVTHESFSKTYRLDLVAGQMVYEFKTVEAFAPGHAAQAIHYAALLRLDRVKLVNFRTPKVIGQLIRAPFARVDRRRLLAAADRWEPLSENCTRLRERWMALLNDWGAFLEANLYEEALIHFFGGETHGVRRVPVRRDGLELGTHRFACHAPDLAFAVTAFTDAAVYESHLARLLQCTRLRGLQWFNLSHAAIELITLKGGQGNGWQRNEKINL